jgi:ABC-2 type transport system permease protein
MTTLALRHPAEPLAGTRPTTRFVLRRNRIRLVVWWVALVGLFGFVAAYYASILATQQALDDFAALSDTPSIRALTGLAAAPDTLGGAVWTKIWMTCALALALGVVFLVTRNGRADEELGRTELLRSRVLGLHAPSAASWLVTAGLCVAVGAGIAVVSAAGGLDPAGAGITGSLVVGASVTGVGLVAVGVGAVAGQVASTSRGANALGTIVLAACYLLRMVGDLGDGTLTWVSPIGWGQEMQPWGANRWWPFGLLVLLTAVLLAVAVTLEGRRDLGAGLLRGRPGPAEAPARYASPLGLALRLQRGPILGWTVGIVVWAGFLGSVVDAMRTLLADAGSPVAALLRGSGMPALLSLLVGMIALVTAVFAIQAVVSLRADEASGLLERQLAGAVPRIRWAVERLLIPAVGSAVLLLAGGALLGASRAGTDPAQVRVLALAALAYWPAIMVLVSVAVALFGWSPGPAIPLSWGVLAATAILMVAGDALHLPAWLLGLLPFSATPYQPAEPLTWTPLIVMTLVAAALTTAGLGRFARRDLRPD